MADIPIDPYEVLGLGRNATDDQIKRAYKKAALASHPDKFPADQKAAAEIKFKEVSEAYEILRDPEARRTYDMYGWEGLKSGGGCGNAGPGNSGNSQFGFWPPPMHQPFIFHDPRSLFAEFLGGQDLFAHIHNMHNMHNMHTRHHQQAFNDFHNSPFNDPFFSSPFGHQSPFGFPPMVMAGGGGSSSFMSSSSFGGNGGSFTSQSTQTTIKNGVRTTITTTSDGTNTRTEVVTVDRNGKETREVTENGVKLVGNGNFQSTSGQITSSSSSSKQRGFWG